MAMPPGQRNIPLRVWSRAIFRGLAKPIACIGGTIAAALLVFTWSKEDLGTQFNTIKLTEDENIVRFSDHCAPPQDGNEGKTVPFEDEDRGISVEQYWGSLRLHSVAVLFSHGDSSPSMIWSEDEITPRIAWDCSPQALPRYWRLNKHVQFRVLGPDGLRLERSFTPDFQSSAIGARELSDEYVCAPGQLTGVGFQQAVNLGRHLSHMYEDHVARAVGIHGSDIRLRIASIDTKRSLASTVGLLMALLATPHLMDVLVSSTEITISTIPNTSVDQRHVDARQSIESGEHLLARWCHQLPLPCRKDALGAQQCLSIEEVAAMVRQEELEACQRFPTDMAPHSTFSMEARLLLHAEDGYFATRSVEKRVLAEALSALLGPTMCNDPLLTRPPFASRLAVERWQDDSTGVFKWRVLWNGKDISARVVGCGAQQHNRGCDEDIIRSLLRLDNVV